MVRQTTNAMLSGNRPSATFRCILALVVVAALCGCNGPIAGIPGSSLVGTEGIASDWGAAANGADTLELETRPDDPYSVRIGFVLRAGRLYIDPAEERRWHAHLLASDSVRVRFTDTIYPARAVRVTDPEELVGFDPTRFVYRLEPRS